MQSHNLQGCHKHDLLQASNGSRTVMRGPVNKAKQAASQVTQKGKQAAGQATQKGKQVAQKGKQATGPGKQVAQKAKQVTQKAQTQAKRQAPSVPQGARKTVRY